MELSDYAIQGTLRAYDNKGRAVDTFWLMAAEEFPAYLENVASVGYQENERLDTTAPFSLRERISVRTFSDSVLLRARYRAFSHDIIDQTMDIVEKFQSRSNVQEF